MMVLDASVPSTDTPQNLRFRTRIGGDEAELVQEFLGTGLQAPRRGQSRTVFVEPAVETGYPDVVVVYSNIRTMEQWVPERGDLTNADLRLLHLLTTCGPWPLGQITEIAGPETPDSLRRLVAADLVYRRGITWHARSLRKSFALRKLVAIEAKVASWRRGLRQAVKNTWFASESYLLVPTAEEGSEVFDEARRLGVGILMPDDSLARASLKATKASLPRSYASWQFNEWAWKTANQQE